MNFINRTSLRHWQLALAISLIITSVELKQKLKGWPESPLDGSFLNLSSSATPGTLADTESSSTERIVDKFFLSFSFHCFITCLPW